MYKLWLCLVSLLRIHQNHFNLRALSCTVLKHLSKTDPFPSMIWCFWCYWDMKELVSARGVCFFVAKRMLLNSCYLTFSNMENKLSAHWPHEQGKSSMGSTLNYLWCLHALYVHHTMINQVFSFQFLSIVINKFMMNFTLFEVW